MAGMRSRPIAAALILLSALLVGADMGQAMSALKRTILGKNNTEPVAYWPLEDGSDATQAGSALSGVPALTAAGSVTFGSFDAVPGASAAPSMPPTSRLSANVSMAATAGWTVAFVTKVVTEDPITSPTVANAVTAFWHAGSADLTQWKVTSTTDGGSFAATAVNIANSSGTIGGTVPATSAVDIMDGEWHLIIVTAEQSGSDVVVTLYVDDVSDSDTATSATLPAISTFALGNLDRGSAELNVTDMHLSHAVIWPSVLGAPERAQLLQAMNGYAGELVRFARLCDEVGVAYSVAS